MSEALEPRDGDELVPADDTIIGRAFRWSLLALGLAGVVALGLYLALKREAPAEAVIERAITAPKPLVQASASAPRVAFKDVTVESGIGFVHRNGARGLKLLPETLGSGAAFIDHDGDGDQDLLLVNARDWPDVPAGGPAPTQALYRNDGSGRFSDVTAAAGLGLSFYGTGVAAGDVDNDGDVDLFLAALGADHLLLNEGGRFRDVTRAAGVAGDDHAWSSSAGFFDHDNDGDLDLFVCNYVQWSRELDIQLNFTLNGRDRAYGPPHNFAGSYPYLYRNEGGGRFTDVSREAGIQIENPYLMQPAAKSLAVTFADPDRDGRLDVFVANDTTRNFLFRNRGDGGFDEIGAEAGVGYDGMGNARGAMGIDAADYRDDGGLAVAIGNFANEATSFYVQQGKPFEFADMADAEGVGPPSRQRLKFGVFFFDYDLDGRLDLLQTNGHLEEEIASVQPSQSYRQAAQLFWNAGPREGFVEVASDTVGDLTRPIVGRGASYADIDGDGDLDVLLTDVGSRPLLLRNEQQLGHHFLRVKLQGTRSNRDAIGAVVELEAGGRSQRRMVMPTRSYQSQVELPVTFGLGQATAVSGLSVRWPSGLRESFAVETVDRLLVLVEGTGTPAP